MVPRASSSRSAAIMKPSTTSSTCVKSTIWSPGDIASSSPLRAASMRIWTSLRLLSP